MVYGSLQWLAVRPLLRLTLSMIGFREAPEDPHRVITPSGRHDEVGVAEQALAEMQQELRAALLQKERLAGVGSAVTKISHDLKNILATAMLESDRLDSVNDPEVRRITAGIVRAIDRAVALSASTLRFAARGPAARQGASASTAARSSKSCASPCSRRCRRPRSYFRRGRRFHLRRRPRAAAPRVRESAAQRGGSRGRGNPSQRAPSKNATPLVCISDNGPGLPAKALKNLFVPFAGSTRVDGSGLGLPIARELLRVQGGDVVLERSDAKGACFAVRLPV